MNLESRESRSAMLSNVCQDCLVRALGFESLCPLFRTWIALSALWDLNSLTGYASWILVARCGVVPFKVKPLYAKDSTLIYWLHSLNHYKGSVWLLSAACSFDWQMSQHYNCNSNRVDQTQPTTLHRTKEKESTALDLGNSWNAGTGSLQKNTRKACFGQ